MKRLIFVKFARLYIGGKKYTIKFFKIKAA